ncbi:Zinc finger, RING/FYVE/PHD-type [Artemisia annua]|uniref:Zinc finger, RING/FYVE/PHD-type n=1 Tax=Artemisia annua TaxID=35608 RepID=A0A2U1NCP6_ARTAN|nr:Zinc finger, RING/FYVE/PHD-type [Artemisia annua]
MYYSQYLQGVEGSGAGFKEILVENGAGFSGRKDGSSSSVGSGESLRAILSDPLTSFIKFYISFGGTVKYIKHPNQYLHQILVTLCHNKLRLPGRLQLKYKSRTQIYTVITASPAQTTYNTSSNSPGLHFLSTITNQSHCYSFSLITATRMIISERPHPSIQNQPFLQDAALHKTTFPQLHKNSIPFENQDTGHLLGALMDDAMILPCGHSFGTTGMEHVMRMKACYTCSHPVSDGAVAPNLSLRSAVHAFRREEESQSHRASKKRIRSDQDRSNYGESAGVDHSRGRGVQYPFSVHEHVIIQGNKRTPPRFVGRKAVVTTQCLNGWYVVKTLDNAESVKLQYRSLAKIQESQPYNLASNVMLVSESYRKYLYKMFMKNESVS